MRQSNGAVLERAETAGTATRKMAETGVVKIRKFFLDKLPWQKKMAIGARQWLPFTAAGMAITAIVFGRRRKK